MTSERYILKHFYYGQFVKNGKPGGDLRLLAKTHGISDEAVAEALKLALIPPMPGTSEGSWSIVRGKKEIPFLLVEGETGRAGQPMLHFILLPSDLLRSLGGNLRQLMPLIAGEMPEYDRVGNTLKPLILTDLRPPDEDQEVDDILEFMDYTGNRMNVMETLLAAVVQGVRLIIRNAPDEPEQHVSFLSGLLALLPPSVRFAVSFATYTRPSTRIDVQVRFLAGDGPDPDDAVVYDWKTKELRGKEVQDGYSRFMISQLRLDPSLVVQQTRRLTAIANWRVKRGDRLAEALTYASNRMSVDDAVLNRQPVEAAEVSRILAADPTLDDDMRAAYARHLMSFSLALGELEHAAPLGMMLRQNKDIEDGAYNQLEQALIEGKAGDVFDLMVEWLQNPLGPQGQKWIDLTHHAARIYFGDIIDDGDIEEIIAFMQDVDRAGTAVVAKVLMPEMIDMVIPLSAMDRELAYITLPLAVKHVSSEKLYDLLQRPDFVSHMPKAMQIFAQAVQLRRPTTTHERLLVNAAAAFKTERVLIVLRLTELALRHNHPEMLDAAALKILVAAARSEYAVQYGGVLRQVVETLGTDRSLQALQEPATRYLLGILLALEDYSQLSRRMIDQSRLLYPGDLQSDYARMILRLFAETPLPPERVPEVLGALEANGIRSLPLAMAFVGVVESQKPSPVTDAVAGDVTEMIDRNATIATMVPVDAVTTLMQYHLHRRDVQATLMVLNFLPEVAAQYGTKTVRMIGTIYKRLDWDPTLLAARQEMLRRYVRALPSDVGSQVVAALGKMLGKDVQEQVEATLALKRLMDGHHITDYARLLHEVADFLNDTAEAYGHSRSIPSQGALLNDLDSLPGGLSNDEKRQIASEIVQAGQAIYRLGQSHSKLRNSDSEKQIEGLLKATENPRGPLEIMRVMGGYLSQGKRYKLELTVQQHPHPLPGRSCITLMQEVQQVHYLMRGTLEALSDVNAQRPLSAKAIYEEVDSLWRTVPLESQRKIVGDLARDLQRVAELVPAIASNGDASALEDSGLGRRLEQNKVRPRSALEFYRFVAGYYLLRS